MAIRSWLTTIGNGTQQSQIQTSGYAPPNDVELAIAIALSPGNYTAILSGKEQRYRQRFDRSVRVELMAPVKPKRWRAVRAVGAPNIWDTTARAPPRNLFERGAKAALGGRLRGRLWRKRLFMR